MKRNQADGKVFWAGAGMGWWAEAVAEESVTFHNSRGRPVEGRGKKVLHKGSASAKTPEEQAWGPGRETRPEWQLEYEQDAETGTGGANWVNHIWPWGRNGGSILGQLGARESVLQTWLIEEVLRGPDRAR